VAYTVVSFHAHPDDESLLTAGTLARAAADGHRVVLVVATLGGAGLTSDQFQQAGHLAERRHRELLASAAALGASRVEWLGYEDSGDATPVGPAAYSGSGGPSSGELAFALADQEQAAVRLARILEAEAADVLTIYDATGGYGHPDHVQVHRVGTRAAALAGTRVVLEATVDRSRLLRAASLASRLPGVPPDFRPERFRTAYTPTEGLTHQVDVRRFADAKRASMAAHASQRSGAGDSRRTLEVFLRLPRVVFRRVFRYEWYVEQGREPGQPLSDDIFATLRDR
jgi:LmbE family N-acetylglucosaminyl deacetylase